MSTQTQAAGFDHHVDLAAAHLGGMALAASDEFFAAKENLLLPGRGIFVADRFTDRGKWMDGWESRRKRVAGHDWCIIRLGLSGVVEGVDIDTNHFLGNHPDGASVEALCEDDPIALETLIATDRWETILDRESLERGSRNLCPVESDKRWTHLRLNIFPDGGVARFRVHGRAIPDWKRLGRHAIIDLAAIAHGGRAISQSDMFFGRASNMLMPGVGKNMGDGWETRRRRSPGHDWCIVELGRPGDIKVVHVDTHHFKGNYPDRCALEGCFSPGATPGDDAAWSVLLGEEKLQPHRNHIYDEVLSSIGPISHVRVKIFPDGGISRLRVFGAPIGD